MTEEEAKTKWCPMVRYGRDGCNVDGRTGRYAAMCIGSACMMWQPLPQGSDKSGRCGLVRSEVPM